MVRASCALVSTRRRRFAGIMVDVFFDHFLARHWHRYTDMSLPVFTRATYRQLLARSAESPPAARIAVHGGARLARFLS